MTEQHPITPPPELVWKWTAQLDDLSYRIVFSEIAQWGADQELEACTEWISTHCATWTNGKRPEDELRAARRPKPLSLKQQTLEALDRMWNGGSTKTDWELFRRALEALPDEELGQ